jgi:exonuclease III
LVNKRLKSPCNLSLLLTNSNGLNNEKKIFNLLNYSKSKKADIMITTETHWKDNSWAKDKRTNRWIISQSDSGKDHASGGVAIWLREDKFKIQNTSILDRVISVDAEFLGQKYRIIGIYAPTGNSK